MIAVSSRQFPKEVQQRHCDDHKLQSKKWSSACGTSAPKRVIHCGKLLRQLASPGQSVVLRGNFIMFTLYALVVSVGSRAIP